MQCNGFLGVAGAPHGRMPIDLKCAWAILPRLILFSVPLLALRFNEALSLRESGLVISCGWTRKWLHTADLLTVLMF